MLPEPVEYRTVDGHLKDVDVRSGVKALQALVGGLIEPVDLWDDEDGFVSVVVNEEGLLHSLPLNRLASDLATKVNGYPYALMGPAFVARWNHDGEMVSLKTSDLDRITNFI